jgi:hypothetical protein
MYELQQFVPGGGAYPNQFVPQQLMPQSLFSGLLGRRFNTPSYGTCGPSGSLGGGRPSLLPFDVDPVALAYLQQAQIQQQQQLQQQQFAPQSVSPYGQQLSPYDMNPVAAALAYQQAQQAQAFRSML